jgi:LysR family transcriptional regulator, glycine cleavage system transcriptional activator
MRDLPPLNALRAFVSTARHLSATKAAAELFVTLGAVSHQLRALEEFLGVNLFVRGHRQLSLTEEGERYFRDVSAAFEAIRSSTDALTNPGHKDVLRVRAYTTFSLRWLIPRLSSFYKDNRSQELVLSTGMEQVDFSRDKLDFAIRLGLGHWPGTIAEKLIPNVLVPVCSPALLARGPVVRKPQDLAHHVLLQSTWPERRDDWSHWLREQGVEMLEDYSFLYFEVSALSYQAAIEGQGFAMAQLALVKDDLAASRLVCPIGQYLDKGEFTYYLLYPDNKRLTPPKKRFRDWLRAECDAFNDAGVTRLTADQPAI